MGFWKRIKEISALDNLNGSWERIDKVPRWIKFPLTDNSNFTFYVKGKHQKYRIDVYNYKTMSQREKVKKII